MSALPRILNVLCDDLLFAILASESIEEGHWKDLLERRSTIHSDALRGLPPPSTLGPVAAWALHLVKDTAAICPPRWMAMHNLIGSGITLHGGARGVRSLFSSKPSEKEMLRVQRLGTLAYRALGATLGADGPPSPDEQLQIQALLLSLGLASEEEKLLAASPVGDASTLEVYQEIEAKSAAQILNGLWLAALRDGLDSREEGAITILATKLSILPKEMASLREEAEQTIEASRLLGRSTIDALYWLLGDDIPTAHTAGTIVANLLLPDPERTELLEAMGTGAPPASVNRTKLSKSARAAALGAAWLIVLRTDPTLCRKAELAARLDNIARALEGDGPKVRATIEATLEQALIAFATPTP